MQEKPILMCGEMVRATLDGTKTNTRRVLKGRHHELAGYIRSLELIAFTDGIAQFRNCMDEVTTIACPYGQTGDHLWVRETFTHHLCCGMDTEEIHYRADGKSCPIDGRTIKGWKPSIHMPRWASRITLEITGVKVEHVQDISPADCRAEGVGILLNDIGARYAFGSLWNQINEKRGYGWNQNPFVWAISFRRIK